MSKYYWLTTPHSGDYEGLKINPSNRYAKEEDLRKNGIWFKDNERDQAAQFLNEVRIYIRHLYCDKYKHKDRASWMDEAWTTRDPEDK